MISIIIVSWNVEDKLRDCIASIFTYSRMVPFEVIVVDNNSSDGTADMVSREFPQVRLIRNSKNAGFASANNEGARVARGSIYYFLNPDTAFVEDTLSVLQKSLIEDAAIAACTGKITYPDGRLQPNLKRNPHFGDQLLIALKLHHIFKPKTLKRYLAKDIDYTRKQPVEQIMGASICMRADIFEELGGWDEGFWLWWEDIDLCKRIQDAGYKIIYTPDTKIIHHEGASFAQVLSLKKQRRFMKGMRRYFKKHIGILSYLVLLGITPLSLFLAFLSQILHVQPRPQTRI